MMVVDSTLELFSDIAAAYRKQGVFSRLNILNLVGMRRKVLEKFDIRGL